jgi:hypothetical protein
MGVGDHRAVDRKPRVDEEVAGLAVQAAIGALEKRRSYFTTSIRFSRRSTLRTKGRTRRS